MNLRRLLICLLILMSINLTLVADEEDAEALMSMVAVQDLNGLKELIDGGADINSQSEMQGMTALIMACTYSFTDIAKYLISEGADVNIQDTMYGTSALFGAAYSSKELVEILLANGADIHIRSKEETTAFTMSVFGALGGSVTTEVASMLLDRGADVDETSTTKRSAGYTCLMMVAGAGDAELVSFLLSKGADINAKAMDGSTALTMAARENNVEMINLLKANGAIE